MIAGLHFNRFVIFEMQFRLAFNDDHPFVFVLIVPETFRTGVPGGDDPLDANVRILGEDRNEFLRKIGS